MALTQGDKNVVSNLRQQYKDDELELYSDETIAQAWRDFNQSDEYHRHGKEPNLFLEWVEMEHAK